MVIVVYIICNTLLVNIYEKDYDHDKIKDKIIKSETKEELQENLEIVHKNTKLRFYLLLGTFGVLFILYVYYKTQTEKSESIAIIFAVCLSMCGKLIEKLGLANCLNLPIIDPQAKPGNVLLFDMFFTNFFAYFIDFIYAFVVVQVGGTGLKSIFKNSNFIKLLTENLSIYSNGKFRPMNILRFVLYYLVIVIFWSWGSIIRPKVSLLVHRYVGIPVVPKENLTLKLKNEEYPLKEFTTDKLVFTYHTIGIIAASVVEGLLFTGLLFPMRKYFIYSLDNKMEFIHDKWSVLAKFISLTLMIPGLIILLTKYTLSDKTDNFKLQKMIAGILTQYIGIPAVLFIVQSLFKVPIIETFTKYSKIAGPVFFILPIILSYLVVYVLKYTGSNYIDSSSDKEKILETFMSEQSSVAECDESQNKYKYIVGTITILFCIICFGPLITVGKLQPLNGLILLMIVVLLLKGIYSVQDNYSEYNILNPMRKNNKGEMDLDTTTGISTVMGCISISVALLLIFKNIR